MLLHKAVSASDTVHIGSLAVGYNVVAIVTDDKILGMVYRYVCALML